MSYSKPPINLEGYGSEPIRTETAFDDVAMRATDIFLDSVLQDDILPQDIRNLFDLVRNLSYFLSLSGI